MKKEVVYFASDLYQEPREEKLRELLAYVRSKDGVTLSMVEAHFETYVDGEKPKRTDMRESIARQRKSLMKKLLERGYVYTLVQYEVFLKQGGSGDELLVLCTSVKFVAPRRYLVSIIPENVDSLFAIDEVDKIVKV